MTHAACSRRMRRRSSRGGKGFCRSSNRCPEKRARRTTSALSGSAEKSKTPHPGIIVRISMAACTPSTSGMLTSLMKRSGLHRRARSTASLPPYVTQVSYPCCDRISASVSATSRLSSVIRTFRLGASDMGKPQRTRKQKYKTTLIRAGSSPDDPGVIWRFAGFLLGNSYVDAAVPTRSDPQGVRGLVAPMFSGRLSHPYSASACSSGSAENPPIGSPHQLPECPRVSESRSHGIGA